MKNFFEQPLTGAAFYAMASVLAGALHYFFQLWAATQLDQIQFGELTSWIAYFSVTLSLGAFAQYAANFFSISSRRLKTFSAITLILAIASLAYGFTSARSSEWVIGLIGLLLGILFSWFSGQAQARLAFVVMGVGILVAGLGKFALAGASFPTERPSLELAWAVSLSYAPALIFMCSVMILTADRWKDVKNGRRALMSGLGATALLSFASAFIPQMDIIAVNLNQTADVIGEFSKVSLLYKAIFFGFLIFAQWMLPHQLSENDISPSWAAWISATKWRRLTVSAGFGIFACAVSLVVAVWLKPALTGRIEWIWLSCLNMVLLTNLFFFIQLSAVKERLLRPALILAALALEVGVSTLFPFTVTQYLIFVTIMNGLLWLFLAADSFD